MTAPRYMICTRCGERINVSRLCTIPASRYICPRCRGQERKEKQS